MKRNRERYIYTRVIIRIKGRKRKRDVERG